MRQPRMPRIEDLPLPAQNEIRARRAAETEQAEKPRPSLLQRLASVGLGRREEQPAARPPMPRPVHRPQGGERLPPYPAPRQAEPRGGMDPRGGLEPRMAEAPRAPEPVSEYAKRAPALRPAPQGLDSHGRPAPVAPSIDDDQLEIPAFLRRQAN